MRRTLALTAAMGLVLASALTARADSPVGSIPECADVSSGAGTYDSQTGALHMEVRLREAPCSPDPIANEDGTTTTTTANYALYVVKDRTFDPNNNPTANLPNAYNLTGPWDQAEFLTDEYSTDPLAVTQITAPEAHVITYDVIVRDDDPTVCVFALITGSTVTTQEVEVANEPVDENGNGTTSDDTHKGNGGENNRNKSPGKFDWGTHTETQEIERIDFFDRAPDEAAGSDPKTSPNCIPFDVATGLLFQAVDDVIEGGSRGFN